MILDISRCSIKVKLMDRVATVHGEMFFSGNEKLGFTVHSDTIRFWDSPEPVLPISSSEKQRILDHIEADFARGGHALEIR